MTFYDLIRAALLKDAEEHPYPGNRGESGQPSTMNLKRDYTAIAMDVKLAQGGRSRSHGPDHCGRAGFGLLYVSEHTP